MLQYQHLLLLIIYIKMLFIFSTPELSRHLWQFKTVVFFHRCLICFVLFGQFISYEGNEVLCVVLLGPFISYEENEVLWSWLVKYDWVNISNFSYYFYSRKCINIQLFVTKNIDNFTIFGNYFIFKVLKSMLSCFGNFPYYTTNL